MAKPIAEHIGVKPTADGLAARAGAAASGKGPPPVHLWNPPFCGDIDMRIARDGTWHYLGSPIGRPALVRLFASILRREGDEFFLVTPAKKLRIRVDDAPFVAVDFTVTGAGRAQAITFTTHVGDTATAGADHPIRVRFARDCDEPSPYVLIRAGLDALIDRKSFYRLIDHAVHEEHRGERWFGLWSGGQFFPVMRSDELE